MITIPQHYVAGLELGLWAEKGRHGYVITDIPRSRMVDTSQVERKVFSTKLKMSGSENILL